MQIDEKKQALGEFLEERKELRYWANRVDSLEGLDTYHSPTATGIPASSGNINQSSRVEEAVVELETARENKRLSMERAEAARTRVIAIIQTAPKADQRIVLLRRYIDGMGWEEIAEASYRSRTWVLNTHSAALKVVQL